MSSIRPVLEAIKRFVRDSEKDNKKVLAWPTCDPSFRISRVSSEDDYIILLGYDEKDREAMMVIPISQFGLQMRCEPADAQRGAIGFISSDRIQS